MWRNKFQLLKQTLNFSQNLEYFIKNLRNINDKSSTDKDSLLIDQENASENSIFCIPCNSKSKKDLETAWKKPVMTPNG